VLSPLREQIWDVIIGSKINNNTISFVSCSEGEVSFGASDDDAAV